MRLTYDELLDNIRDNLGNTSYERVADLYNLISALSSAVHKNPVRLHYPEVYTDPVFIED